MTDSTRPKYFRAENLEQAWQFLEEAGPNAQAAWVSPRPSDPGLDDVDAGLELAAAGLGIQQFGLHHRNLLQRGVEAVLGR